MMLENLKRRNLTPEYSSGIWPNEQEITVTFGLWNLYGPLVGFHEYRLLPDNEDKNNTSAMRYFTVASKTDKYSKLLAFAIDLLDRKQEVLFLAEGVDGLETLSSNPAHLASWLRSTGYYLVALCEGDGAGKKLAGIADEAIYLPKGKDPAEWFDELVNKYTKENCEN